MKLPANLSQAAIRDLRTILKGSRDYGSISALQLQARIFSRFAPIGDGRGLGHIRVDAPFEPQIRFMNLKSCPFVIVYDADARVVLRIIHGARDFRSLLTDGG